MAIQQINTSFTGQVGIRPNLIRILCDDSFATVTATNYLLSAKNQGFAFNNADMALITYGSTPVTQFFTVSISSGDITLEPVAGEVTLPVVSGDFAVFTGTAGALDDLGYSPSDATKTKVVMASAAVAANRIACFADTAGTINDDAATAINGGNIQAGLSGTAGHLASFPTTAAKGSLRVVAADNTGDTVTTITNAAMGQATTLTIPDPTQSTGSILVSKVEADPGANLISFDITVGQAALASGGSVTLVPSSGSKQYRVRQLYLNLVGTNFSGGGGDRLGQITDNTSIYANIPAATMQSLANARWGETALTFPPLVSINQSTAAGDPLVFKYSGGTTDYTAGSLVISIIVERVA